MADPESDSVERVLDMLARFQRDIHVSRAEQTMTEGAEAMRRAGYPRVARGGELFRDFLIGQPEYQLSKGYNEAGVRALRSLGVPDSYRGIAEAIFNRTPEHPPSTPAPPSEDVIDELGQRFGSPPPPRPTGPLSTPPGAPGILDTLAALGGKLEQLSERVGHNVEKIPGATPALKMSAFFGRGLREMGEEIPEAKALSLLYDLVGPPQKPSDVLWAVLPFGKVVRKGEDIAGHIDDIVERARRYVDPWATTAREGQERMVWQHFTDDEFPLVSVIVPKPGQGEPKIRRFSQDVYNRATGERKPEPEWLQEFWTEHRQKLLEDAPKIDPRGALGGGSGMYQFHIDRATGNLVTKDVFREARERSTGTPLGSVPQRGEGGQ